MRAAIYGVGRSGTKALQLWAAASLAQTYDAVWVTYEPFHWQDRKLTPSQRGQALHRSLPFFTEQAEGLDTLLADTLNQPVSVTKMIRANGRVAAVERVLQPDVSILVIRDLYSVLESIAVENWNLVDKRDWRRLCEEAASLYPFLAAVLRPTTDKILTTAVFWFAMNHHALQHSPDYTHVVRYTDLASLGGRFDFLRGRIDDYPGDNLHRDWPLQDVPPARTGLFQRQPDPVGSLCRLVTETPPADEAASLPRTRVSVRHSDLFDELVGRVETLMVERAS